MQLRTVKKKKSKAIDLGGQIPQEHSIQIKISREQEEKGILSSNENSNTEKENEIKGRHILRNQSNNYQGKYKRMNSGKYLYNNNSEKKPVFSKKKKLRFFPNEIVQTFKNFLIKLNKKEDSLLNKKKKREEGEEVLSKHKGVIDGQENKKKINSKQNNINQFQPMGSPNINELPQQYMLKKNPYEFYNNQNSTDNVNHRYPMENQGLFYRMNKDFMRLIHMPEYYYQGLLPQQIQCDQEPKPKSESIFNLISDKENLNRINKIANEGVNHIVAAFYIKSIQQSRNVEKNTDNSNSNIIKRTSLTVNSVNLEEGKELNLNKTSCILQENANPNDSTKQILYPKNNALEKGKITNNTFDLNLNINNMMIFNDKYDKFSPDVNEFTFNQLKTVNTVMKKLKENKINEIIDYDYQSKK